ncbi:MAG TPA: ChaN family lipoprotein [Bacteroidales bacterium]|nr:ChaN family lipoprotein [Bacteroidales bacterium]HPS26414.1 ChaN family lipoprotein [Bacteroidales bacterium]
MTKTRILIILVSFFLLSMTVDKPAYQIYNVTGKKTTYQKMVKDIMSCEVVLFGELHNNPISHWMELQLTKDLFKEKKQDLILGAEMFEADMQETLDKYLKGQITEDELKTQIKLWPNYETDYRPLLEFARNTNLKFLATNAPRKYASLVMHQGFEKLNTLSDEEKKFLAPLPIEYDPELEQYKKMIEMDMAGLSSPNLPKAQALKDATMAHFIFSNAKDGKLFLHYNGSYHSDYFEGIMWYLKRKNADLKILTIATVEQSDISKLSPEYIMVADYIICVPDDMTKTY